MFLRCANLHLESGKISENVLQKIDEILDNIKAEVDILDEEISHTKKAVQKNLEAR